jgi:hypothetical protein
MIKFNVFIYQSEEEYYDSETWYEADTTDYIGLPITQAVALFNKNLTAFKIILVNQSVGWSDIDRLYIDASHGTSKNFIISDTMRCAIFSSEIEQL